MRGDFGGGEAAAVRLAGGAPLQTALTVADPLAWLALDTSVRAVDWYRPSRLPLWEHTAPLPAGAASFDEPRLALALCHRDGRIRERAVRQAAAYPALLPLLVIRASDWAEPVRERARALLRDLLVVDTAVALTPLILLVGRRDRGNAAVGLLGEILRRAPRECLDALFGHADRGVRRFAYRLAVEERLLTSVELARTASRDEDVVVQTLCGEAALAAVGDSSTGAPDDDVFTPLLGARFPRVRAIGVTALRRAGRPARAEEFLADRAALVRACARYVLRQHGIDPLPWYRRRCCEPGDAALPPGAAIGLAECGQRTDAALLWPLLTHPTPGVRARAVAGLRTLDVTDTRRLLPLLDDAAPGVVREVTAALLPSARSVDTDWLTARLASDQPRHVRVAAFRLLDATGGLERLRASVTLLEDPDHRLRSWAEQSVQGWHLSADVPRGAAEVGELLQRGHHLFSDHVYRRLRWEAGLDR
ncbi:hypothetical protein ACIHCX_37435 [Streptomyces sp. NPDC052043]|uniref:hypothetical protein n=1 Tax=Streptomyces sp. NPDC052043 TaxID=3365684 RepID=UPI0037D92A77